MKLDHKRTVLVGLAFLSICAFWQMYDNIIPLILTNTFHLDETISGAIMAADNVLALFLLPFFGALSDRTSTKIGRRMPFILGGTAAAVILMNLLPLFDNGYANGASTGKLAMFVVTLGLLLVAMGTYRSPAVALMPDVTPKPIRSRANAIINLMGAVGGISYLIAAAVLYPNSKTAGAAHVNYQPLFIVVSVLMAVSVIVLYFTTNEPKLAAAEKEYEAEHPEQQLVEEEPDGSEELPKEVKRSLVMLLNSIALWYIGYNGVTTWWTTYVGRDELIKTLTGWNGAVRGDAVHKQIVDAYNSYLPHPRGYKLTYTDDYCAAAVSAAAILCGLTEVLPVECSCGEQMRWYQASGQWIEDDAHVPQVGEQVFYHWADGGDYAATDCTGAPNHTGIVTRVVGSYINVFEGNKGSKHECGYRTLEINGRYIRGFGIPAYPAEKRTLVRGDKGEEVKKLQEFLNVCGYGLDVDGSFGPATQQAWGEYLTAYIQQIIKE